MSCSESKELTSELILLYNKRYHCHELPELILNMCIYMEKFNLRGLEKKNIVVDAISEINDSLSRHFIENLIDIYISIDKGTDSNIHKVKNNRSHCYYNCFP